MGPRCKALIGSKQRGRWQAEDQKTASDVSPRIPIFSFGLPDIASSNCPQHDCRRVSPALPAQNGPEVHDLRHAGSIPLRRSPSIELSWPFLALLLFLVKLTDSFGLSATAGDGCPRHIIRRLIQLRRRQQEGPRYSAHQRVQLRRGRLYQVRSVARSPWPAKRV